MKSIIPIVIFFVAVLSIPACKSGDEQKPENATIDTASIKASIDSLGGMVQKAHDIPGMIN